MKIYSPSQTETYLFCPVKRWLQYREHITPRAIGRPGVARLLGHAFAAGMAVHYSARKVGTTNPKHLEIVKAVGQESLRQEIEKLTQAGHTFYEETAPLSGKLDAALSLLLFNDPVPLTWTILEVEHTLKDAGFARIDLVVQDDIGTRIVVDGKLKLNLDPRYHAKEVAKVARSWQMFHYVDGYAREEMCEVPQYALLWVILAPKPKVEWHPVWVMPEALAQWRAFAEATWADMEAEDAGTRRTRGQTKCSDEFGPCPMTRWCWELYGQEERVAEDYVKET